MSYFTIKKSYSLGAILILYSCTGKTLPQTAAEEFCDCMQKNNALKNYKQVIAKCDSPLIEKYPLYKIDKIDFRDSALFSKISVEKNKQVAAFMIEFWDNTNKNCYEIAGICNADSGAKK